VGGVQSSELLLFPANAVLFPGVKLPLQIVEPRYLDMVAHCARNECGFGVVYNGGARGDLGLDLSGAGIGTGTEAWIVDFDQASNGILNVVTRGSRKFLLHETSMQGGDLLAGRVDFLADETPAPLMVEHAALVDLLRALVLHPSVEVLDLQVNFDDALAVSFCLSHLLPIDAEMKQQLLEMTSPGERLAELNEIVDRFQG